MGMAHGGRSEPGGHHQHHPPDVPDGAGGCTSGVGGGEPPLAALSGSVWVGWGPPKGSTWLPGWVTGLEGGG